MLNVVHPRHTATLVSLPYAVTLLPITEMAADVPCESYSPPQIKAWGEPPSRVIVLDWMSMSTVIGLANTSAAMMPVEPRLRPLATVMFASMVLD